MTVASGIEIGAGATSAPGLGKALGAEPSGAVSHGSAPGAVSFRSGWQSMLASLGSTPAISGGNKAAAAGQGSASVQAALEKAAKGASGATPTLAGGAGLRLGQKTVKGSGERGVAALSVTDAQAEAFAAHPATGAAKPEAAKISSSTKTEEKKPAAEPELASSGGPHTTHSINVAPTEVNTARAVPGVAVEMAALPQAAPAPVVTASTAYSTEISTSIKEQAAQAIKDQSTSAAHSQVDLPIALPAGFTPTPIPPYSSRPEVPGGVSGAAKTAVQEMTEGDETTSKQGQLLPVQGTNRSSGATLNITEPPNVQEKAPPQVAVPTEGGNPAQPPAPCQNPVHAFSQGQEQHSMQLEGQGMNAVPALTSSTELNSLPVENIPTGQPSAVPLIAGKSGTASGGKSSVPGTARSRREVENSDALQPGRTLTQVQSPADASAVSRDLAGAHELVGVKTIMTTGPDTRETFATLDAEGATGKPTWIHAGMQRAEAGFQDPALGWVGVRADVSGGGVHAELMAGSADAAQALGGHMAGLNAYLAEHHTPVDTLTLTTPEGGGAGLSNNQGSGQHMQQGTGQQSGQETVQGGESGFLSAPSAERATLSAAALPAWSARLDGGARAAEPVGGHISVMA